VFDLKTGDSAPLGGLFQTRQLSAFVIDETIDGDDRDGDGFADDSVVTLRNRKTGVLVSIGAGGADGVAVAKVVITPFEFPAFAVEEALLAFFEADSSLRLFRVDGTEVTSGNESALKDPLVNGRSLVVSDEQVFVRAAVVGNGTELQILDATASTPSLQSVGKKLATATSPVSVAGGGAA